MNSPRQSHDGLAQSLAAHLRSAERMTWCDLQLGPSGSPRPDVYSIFRSYSHPCPTAYECKVSRSDFLADVTAGKWQTYLRYASAVYFACEDGLVSPKEVPAHCGLIVLKNVWRVKKRAVLSPVTVPQDALLKLLIDGVQREGPVHRAKIFNDSIQNLRASARFGDLVGKVIRDRMSIEREIESAKYTADRIVKEARRTADRMVDELDSKLPAMRRDLCEALGIPADSSAWSIQQAVQRLKRDQEEHPAEQKHRLLSEAIERVLLHHGFRNQLDTEEVAT